MALVLTVVAALVLLVLGIVGYWRDIRRGILALAGTLLGAILVGFWGEPWGQELAKRFVGGDRQTLTFVVNCVVFLFAALFVGYGGGLLLGRAKEPAPFPRRLAGALIGLLNGALIVGYVLRFATSKNSAFLETVQSIALARVLHDGLPLLFLGLTIGVTALVLLRLLLLAVGISRPAPTKPAADARPAAPTAKPPTQQDRQRDVVNKIERRL